MGKGLYPDEYGMKFINIDFKRLHKQGIRAVILDIDNTMLPYYVPEPDAVLKLAIQRIRKAGLDAYIVSNGRKERVERFNQNLGLPYICRAKKPSSKGFTEALKTLGCQPEQIAVIGDQIFTDVWGGNRMGMYTIMVSKVVKKDEWITAIKRPLEKIVLWFYKLKK